MHFLIFNSGPDYSDSILGSINDDERSQQKSPLCKTPTSQLLQLAAQFLPPSPLTVVNQESGVQERAAAGAQSALDLLKQGWWKASPSQLQEVSNSIKNAGLVDQISELGLSKNLPNLNLPKKVADSLKQKSNENPISSKIQDDTQKENKLSKASKSSDKQEGNKDDYKVAVQSLSATISYLKQQNGGTISDGVPKKTPENSMQESHKPISLLKKVTNANHSGVGKVENDGTEQTEDISKKVSATKTDVNPPAPSDAKPLQPGSYWYAKYMQNKTANIELPQNSSKEVRQVIASLTKTKYDCKPIMTVADVNLEAGNSKEEIITPQASIDVSGSYSADTITDFPDPPPLKADKLSSRFVIQDTRGKECIETVRVTRGMDLEHKLGNCVAEDCMCYEAVFRQDQPIETSSIKSESSFSESPDISPKKVVKLLSTSSLSEDSINNSINRRRSRIAAKFVQPLE